MESDEENLSSPFTLEKEMHEGAKIMEINLLPTKSKKIYVETYKKFLDYRNDNNIRSFSESILLTYFGELSKKMKSSSLWSIYSMLKSTLNVNNNIDISKYLKLRAFLKRQNDGYRAKKSRVLEREHIEKFLLEAPDKKYLCTKVALLFGIAGACRCGELVQMKLDDIEDIGNKLLITLSDTKTKKQRSFVVTDHLDLYRKYTAFRLLDMNSRRFFFRYADGKASKQLIGIHTFGKMPEKIADYLQLPNIKEYTGHCFRRTSATLLVHSGANITMLNRYGGWKSTTLAEGNVEESTASKSVIGERIFPFVQEGINNCNVDAESTTTNVTAKSDRESVISSKDCSSFTRSVEQEISVKEEPEETVENHEIFPNYVEHPTEDIYVKEENNINTPQDSSVNESDNLEKQTSDIYANNHVNDSYYYDTSPADETSNISTIAQTCNENTATSKIIDNTSDEFSLFALNLAAQLRQLPLSRALILQRKLQDIVIEERLRLLDVHSDEI